MKVYFGLVRPEDPIGPVLDSTNCASPEVKSRVKEGLGHGLAQRKSWESDWAPHAGRASLLQRLVELGARTPDPLNAIQLTPCFT